MNRPNNRPNHNNLDQPTTLNNVHGRPITTDEKAYRDGYVEGRTLQRDVQYQREKVAESNGIANGMIIGGVLALVVGLGAAAIAYYNRSPAPAPVTSSPTSKVITPPASPSPTTPAKQTTIIERTVEKVAPAAPPEVKVIEVPKAVPVPIPVAPSVAPPSAQTAPQAPSSTSGNSSPSDSSIAPNSDTSPNNSN